MSKRYAKIVILAEDERSANLMRRYVMRALNLKNNRSIEQEISPSARGDAKQWVLAKYPLEVKALRRNHPKTGLVVHIDADVDSVAERARQLAEALRNIQESPRQANERISHAIPRRHTETWLCILTGINVTEDQDCKRQHLPPNPDEAVKPSAEALYKLTRPNAQPASLPSLMAAVPELRRLEQ